MAQASRIASFAIQIVSSSRSNFTACTIAREPSACEPSVCEHRAALALASSCTRRAKAGCDFNCSISVMGEPAASEITPLDGRKSPVEHTFLPHIEEADEHDPDVDHHLPKAKQLQFAQDHGPGVKENGLHVE